MADPLSLTGTAVGIVSLGLQVCKGLVSYYQGVKDQSKDISATIQSLESLSRTLENFIATVDRHRFLQGQSKLVHDIEDHIYACEDAIDELDQELEKFTTSGSGVRHMIKSTARKATYPFREGTLMKLRENIQDILENLALASNILLLETSSQALDKINQVSTVLSLLRTDLVSSDIRQWLNAPNTHSQHEDACAKRHKNTGLWFVDGSRFDSWLSTKPSFLWLNGFAGSGKTILASTIIQKVLAYRDSSPTIGIAYFYLSYADTSKQSTRGLIKSLLLQLSCQSSSGALNNLYADYSSGGPPEYALVIALEAIVATYTDTYIIIDALDESPKGEHRNAVCKLINKLRNWSNIHLLVTSRDEPDIRESLAVPKKQDVSIVNDEVADDIRRFVKEALREDTSLIKWKLFYGEIESAIIQGARGMFRWVDCQLFALRSCLTANMLRATLKSLPATLDATYDRMLGSINPELRGVARRLLTLLCFSARPLRVCELTEALAISSDDGDGHYDLGDKIFNMSDLLSVCPGMIRVKVAQSIRQNASVAERDLDFSDRAISRRVKNSDRRIVHLAHFSVQEYLVSNRILQSSRDFHLQPGLSHAWIAKICLIYLSMPQLRLPSDLKPWLRFEWYIGTFDFLDYAQNHWADHTVEFGADASLVPLIKKILTTRSLYTVLATLETGEHYLKCATMDSSGLNTKDRISMAVKWLTYHGAVWILEIVLAQPWDFVNMDRDAFEKLFVSDLSPLDSTEGWRSRPYSSLHMYERQCKFFPEGAVNIAIRNKNWKVANLLLERSFRPSKTNLGILDSLQIAARDGLEKTVELLLYQGRTLVPENYSTLDQSVSSQHPVLMAAWHGHTSTVKKLLERCVLARIEGRHGVTALHIAARRGHLDLVKFLIDDAPAVYSPIDHQTDYGSTAAMRAAERGHCEIVKFLVRSGTDWQNTRDVDGNNVIVLAVGNNRLDIVQFLTSRGVCSTLRNSKGEDLEQVALRLGFDDIADHLHMHWTTASAAKYPKRKPLSQTIHTRSTATPQIRSPDSEVASTSLRPDTSASDIQRARNIIPWRSRVLALSNDNQNVAESNWFYDNDYRRDFWE